MELHEVKTTVTIDTVKLNVRFPGQLSFQLKNSTSSNTQPSSTKISTLCTPSPTANAKFRKQLRSQPKPSTTLRLTTITKSV